MTSSPEMTPPPLDDVISGHQDPENRYFTFFTPFYIYGVFTTALNSIRVASKL